MEDNVITLRDLLDPDELDGFEGFIDPQRDAMIERLSVAAANSLEEAVKASEKFAKFNSAHEGYAVLLKEVDELWEHVKTNQKRRDYVAMRKEAIQVAAMALRFVADIADMENRT